MVLHVRFSARSCSYCLGDDGVGFCDDGYIGVNDGEDDGECEEDDGDGEDVEDDGDGEDVEDDGDGEDVEDDGDGEDVEDDGDGEDVEDDGDGEDVDDDGDGEDVEDDGDGEDDGYRKHNGASKEDNNEVDGDDEEENEDGSISDLIDQVCAYLTTGKYKDSSDKNKKRMIRKKAQRFTTTFTLFTFRLLQLCVTFKRKRRGKGFFTDVMCTQHQVT